MASHVLRTADELECCGVSQEAWGSGVRMAVGSSESASQGSSTSYTASERWYSEGFCIHCVRNMDQNTLSFMRAAGMLSMRMLACTRSLPSAGWEGWYWLPSPVLHVTKLYVSTPVRKIMCMMKDWVLRERQPPGTNSTSRGSRALMRVKRSLTNSSSSSGFSGSARESMRPICSAGNKARIASKLAGVKSGSHRWQNSASPTIFSRRWRNTMMAFRITPPSSSVPPTKWSAKRPKKGSKRQTAGPAMADNGKLKSQTCDLSKKGLCQASTLSRPKFRREQPWKKNVLKKKKPKALILYLIIFVILVPRGTSLIVLCCAEKTWLFPLRMLLL
eukprot:m.23856 g.23856  ORF g.23856 m.23856 type:complete len:332 (-) comp8583_c1_seq1:1961-2956(-)